MKIIIFIIAIFSLSSCGLTSKTINNCGFDAIQGEEFVFRTANTGSPQLDGFNTVPAEGWETTLSYKKYINARGKVYKMPPKEEFPSWAEISTYGYTPVIFDTCEVYYARNFFSLEENTLVKKHIKTAYFLSDLDNANKLIGKTVWKKKRASREPHEELLDLANGKAHSIAPYEGLEVTGVDKTIYGRNRNTRDPFYLKVKDKSGNEGVIRYASEAIFQENPINNDWDDSIINAIKQSRAVMGMTTLQAALAVGYPEDINSTRTSNSYSEQWVYTNGLYLYFDRGILTAIQN
jgi:hypothetical protein